MPIDNSPIELPAFLLNTTSAEGLLTVKEAAKALNLPAWKLWRAVNKKLLRSYRFMNGRIYLRLSDVSHLLELAE